jgi:hypothetical protein
VIQEERPILGGGGVTLSVVVKEMSHCEWLPSRELFESPDLSLLEFCLWGWMKSEVYKIKVDTVDEVLTRILDAAARIKKCEYQLRRTTRDLRTRFVISLGLTVGFSNIYCEL